MNTRAQGTRDPRTGDRRAHCPGHGRCHQLRYRIAREHRPARRRQDRHHERLQGRLVRRFHSATDRGCVVRQRQQHAPARPVRWASRRRRHRGRHGSRAVWKYFMDRPSRTSPRKISNLPKTPNCPSGSTARMSVALAASPAVDLRHVDLTARCQRPRRTARTAECETRRGVY